MKLRFNSIRIDKAFAFTDRSGKPAPAKFEGLVVLESDEGTINLKVDQRMANRILDDMQYIIHKVVEEQLTDIQLELFPSSITDFSTVPVDEDKFEDVPVTGHDGLKY